MLASSLQHAGVELDRDVIVLAEAGEEGTTRFGERGGDARSSAQRQPEANLDVSVLDATPDDRQGRAEVVRADVPICEDQQ